MRNFFSTPLRQRSRMFDFRPKARAKAISRRMLMQRVQRRLAPEGRVLRRSREGTQERLDWGEFYLVDGELGEVVEAEIDLEDLGRELGALSFNETLISE